MTAAADSTSASRGAVQRISEIRTRVDAVIHRRQNAHLTQGITLWVTQDDVPWLLDHLQAVESERDDLRAALAAVRSARPSEDGA